MAGSLTVFQSMALSVMVERCLQIWTSARATLVTVELEAGTTTTTLDLQALTSTTPSMAVGTPTSWPALKAALRHKLRIP